MVEEGLPSSAFIFIIAGWTIFSCGLYCIHLRYKSIKCFIWPWSLVSIILPYFDVYKYSYILFYTQFTIVASLIPFVYAARRQSRDQSPYKLNQYYDDDLAYVVLWVFKSSYFVNPPHQCDVLFENWMVLKWMSLKLRTFSILTNPCGNLIVFPRI